MTKLTAKQEAFCREYMVDFNATQAAIRAGYSENTARSIGQENLTKPDIQEKLAELSKEATNRNEITVDEIIQHDAAILRTQWGEVNNFDGYAGTKIPASELTEEQKKAVIGIENINNKVYYKLADRDKAKDRLMRYLGGFAKDNERKVTLDKDLSLLDLTEMFNIDKDNP